MSQDPAPAGRPSVFLSYASEDRPAIRKLRDALNEAGIDAWYDENELTGGDAWDAKIRRQIRECTYFMPVISTRASARLEGYFRREWRFALERMLDMADDIVFLLPVTIDESTETTARVPEKFVTVQWLRVPEGDATPAFRELARRLAAGGPHRLHHAPTVAPRPDNLARAPQYLPPLSSPAPVGRWKKTWRAWLRLPLWVRVIGWIVFIIVALNACTHCSFSVGSAPPPVPGRPDEIAAKVNDSLRRLESNSPITKRPADLIIVTHSAAANGTGITGELFGKLVVLSGVRTSLSTMPLKDGETPAARGATLGARLVLSCAPDTVDAKLVTRVKIERTADGSTVWSADFPATENAGVIARETYPQIAALLLKKD
ncbi:MAG: toll/interleukin-1 receptor domain-containing protein [Candidatus Didemnitutus sp.]|nr:toll/interleukin-1 receptor domain-containing protein [Candidatus Didemnitutus sp.]